MSRFGHHEPALKARSKRTFSVWCDDHLVAWKDIRSGKIQLQPGEDCILVDQAKYSTNIGSILRHMPIFGGQVLFITNSSSSASRLHLDPEKRYQQQSKDANPPGTSSTAGNGNECETQQQIFQQLDAGGNVEAMQFAQKLRTYPEGSGLFGYTKKFAKDCLRISMAYTRASFYPKLCVDADLFEVLDFFKNPPPQCFVGCQETKNVPYFSSLVLENVEAFYEAMTESDESNQDAQQPKCNLTSTSSSDTAANTNIAAATIENTTDAKTKITETETEDTKKVAQIHSIWDCPILGDWTTPVLFVFGGESAGVPASAMRLCDGGAFVPSCLTFAVGPSHQRPRFQTVEEAAAAESCSSPAAIELFTGAATMEKAASQQPEGEGGAEGGQERDGDERDGVLEISLESVGEHNKHTCNLSSTAAVVMAERMRRKVQAGPIFGLGVDAAETEKQGQGARGKRVVVARGVRGCVLNS